MPTTVDLKPLLNGNSNGLKADHDPLNVMSDDPASILGNGIQDLGDTLLHIPVFVIAEIAKALTGAAEGTLDTIAGWVSGIPIIGDIVHAITGLVDGGLENISNFFSSLEHMFGGPDFNSGSFNPVQAVINFITTMIQPLNMLASLIGGFISQFNIPGLDASKIISGQFAQEMIHGLGDALAAPFRLIQQVLDAIWNGLTGGSPDNTGATPDILHALMGGVRSSISTIAGQLGDVWSMLGSVGATVQQWVQNLSSLPIYQSAEDFVDNAVAAVAGLAHGFVGALDSLFNALTGQVRSYTDTGGELPTSSVDTAAQLQALVQTVTSHTIAIGELQTNTTGNANSGLASKDDFEIPHLYNLGSGWQITADNGYAQYVDSTLVPGTAAWRAVTGTHNVIIQRIDPVDRHTQTDWQDIGMTVTSPMIQSPYFSDAPNNSIYGCMSDDGTQYVRAEITDSQASLRYKNGSGAEVVCPSSAATAACKQAAGVRFNLLCGEDEGINYYALTRNGQRVVTFVDSPTTPVIARGSGNRGWGFGMGAGGYGGTQKKPSAVALVTVADNIPNDTVGEGFRVFRSSAAATASHGVGVLEDVFDTVDRRSNDMVWSGGKVTIVTAGWWVFDSRIRLNDMSTHGIYRQAIYQTRVIGGVVTSWIQAIGAPYTDPCVGGSVIGGGNTFVPVYAGMQDLKDMYVVYCEVGDLIEPYLETMAHAQTIVGNAGGTVTYFAGALASGASDALVRAAA